MVANNHLVAVRNVPGTLNVEGVFSNLLRVVTGVYCPALSKLEPFPIGARPEDQSGFPISTSGAF